VQNQKKLGLFRSLKESFSCGAFVILCVITILFLLGTSIFDSYGRYVGTYYVLGGDWDKASKFVALGTIIYTSVSLIMIQVYRWVSERIGKNKTLMISMLLVLFSVSITWWTNNPQHPYWMLINSFFIGAGYAGIWLMIPSMQIDVVDYDELHTGERREGSFASIFSWVLKISFCLGYMLSGPLLTMTGFHSGLEGPELEKALFNMRVGYIILPVTALIIALFLLKIFPLTHRKLLEIRGELEARRGKI
jgi:GPH family glycoside/pentoside/hexuronide:cation symporter